MTIRFAAAPQLRHSHVARVLSWNGPQAAANDNPGKYDPLSTRAVRDALAHFAIHGMRAASEARHAALDARASGNSAAFRHWVSICRVLDDRLADQLAPQEAC
ncbi:MAG: hypothetical protein ABGW87_02040 [Sphingomonadaceae bacterium]